MMITAAATSPTAIATKSTEGYKLGTAQGYSIYECPLYGEEGQSYTYMNGQRAYFEFGVELSDFSFHSIWDLLAS